MRGGTGFPELMTALCVGLSPHARGNPANRSGYVGNAGSIPACAGEPLIFFLRQPDKRVYPRMRGGTGYFQLKDTLVVGLSPHARGNLGGFPVREPAGGSIPACAGEPTSKKVYWVAEGVYPRMRGGTTGVYTYSASHEGLSPHARGNLASRVHLRAFFGSIPACAGEPSAYFRYRRAGRVYPRMRGGTASGQSRAKPTWGLSPHARGNRPNSNREDGPPGSIPACAGEPAASSFFPCPVRVYPRMRGGTFSSMPMKTAELGLSPHARGNLVMARNDPCRTGSIPACAGEPSCSLISIC